MASVDKPSFSVRLKAFAKDFAGQAVILLVVIGVIGGPGERSPTRFAIAVLGLAGLYFVAAAVVAIQSARRIRAERRANEQR